MCAFGAEKSSTPSLFCFTLHAVIRFGILIFLGFILSCKPKPSENASHINDFSTRMEGVWICMMDEDTVFESWSRENDSLMKGLSFTVNGPDTMLEEIIVMRKTGGLWRYCPSVANQNDGKEICFVQSVLSDSLIRFKNTAHDFPQYIEYRKNGEHSMEAKISGPLDGRDTAFVFTLFKLPEP